MNDEDRTQPALKPGAVIVSVGKDGKITVGGKPVAAAELTDWLKQQGLLPQEPPPRGDE